MANPSMDDILNMKSSQLKEFLEDHHVPMPRRQSKEFLQTVALQTHADIEAEMAKRRIITRRRSKREETDVGSTYSGIYGRSSSMPGSNLLRSSPSRSPSMNTRSRVQAYIKTEAESPNERRQEQAVEKEEAADVIKPAPQDQDHLHDQEKSLPIYSLYSATLHTPTTPDQSANPTPDANILSGIDANEQVDHAGNRSDVAAAHSSKEDHPADASHQESADKLAMIPHQESTDMGVVPPLESIKESKKAMENESIKKQSRPYQEVVKKIIRVNDGNEHQERNKAKDPWILKKPLPPQTYYKEGHHAGKGHHDTNDQHNQGSSRMQRLKRSASMIVSQVNERVFKRLRKVSTSRLHYRPSLHVSIALLMCAICATAIGAASYWYHLKKVEEAQLRAQKRWLW